MSMYSGKIFGIGFHKTGTSSLARALDLLGYRVTGSFGLVDNDIANTVLVQAFDIVQDYDAFQDNPWPVIYRELDKRFPGSKFILTMRPTEQWLTSALRHFGGKTTPMRQWIYGIGNPRGNETIYRQRYEQHNRDVIAYFDGRPNDLLVFNITEGDGWEQLCPFLNAGIPALPFPHSNSAAERKKLINRLKGGVNKLRSLTYD